MGRNIFLSVLVSLMIINCGLSKDSLIPDGLQCEYQTEPIGIDVSAPRFGWRLNDSGHVRGQRQTAYSILVASSLRKLTETGADVWNSGKVNSPQSVSVS
ncbi:MAG: alpha-rhamnosidase, partial [Prevotellaceae bacterium]|nr:alpha-rhamnosidase [Prevotellaceae bacterium]